MGAIFGLVGRHSPESIEIMAERLKHRGRARHMESVHDVSVGAVGDNPGQMIYRDGTDLIVAAGDLYVTGGAAPPHESWPNLAEVLYRQIRTGDLAGLTAIEGDYAAAACQGKGGQLTLMRDFFGCMPLYWGVLATNCVAFASEYKAILALGSFIPVVDRHMLQYLQAAKRIPVGRTLLKNVSAARPGLTVIEEQAVTKYQDFPPLTCDVRIHDEKTAQQLVAEQFRNALQQRSARQNRIGLALSGGIDSIAMAFQLRSLSPDEEIHTFTAGYGEDDPEMQTAAEAAAQISAVHHPVVTPPNLLVHSFNKLVWHLEDPTSRSEALQLMCIGEAASPFVDRLLSGQGVDGLFAGMPRHRLLYMAEHLPPIRGALLEILDLTQMGIQPDSVLGRAFAAALYRGKVPPVPLIIDGGTIERLVKAEPGPQYLNRILAADYRSSALQDAAKFERTFGASGVGYSSPCLDPAFARTAFTIDQKLKLKRGYQKYIFRRALSPVVPRSFRVLPKHPQRMEYNLAFADCLDGMADDLLSPTSVRSRGFFLPSSVDRLRRRTGRPYAPEAAMRLWTAMGTEVWARLFLDNEQKNPVEE